MSERALPLASLVPPQLRELLRARALVLHRPVFGRRLGRHRSARAGVGLDFRDHRPYVPGDDPRRLDWRAVARRERLVLRQTEAEDELSILFAVDAGGSMAYGEGDTNKARYARALVGGLAWLASRQGDPVGLVRGHEGEVDDTWVRPSASPERLAGFATVLSGNEPSGTCPWLPLLEAMTPRLPRRSVVLAVGDFLDPSGDGQPDDGDDDRALIGALASIRARGHDVVLLQVLHADELEFPWADRSTLRFSDLFGIRKVKDGAAAAMREGYLAALRAHQARLSERCDREGLILHTVRTDEDLVESFLGLMARFDGSAPQGDAA